MPFNGSGTFALPVISGWPAASGAVISSTAVNSVIEDLVAGLTAVLPRDGQSAMTGDLLMGGNLITNCGYVAELHAADIASAGTVNIGAAVGRTVFITGTTTITSFGTVGDGVIKIVRFTGALTLTHNAISLILPGGANITTAAGDALLAMSLGAGNWVVLFYQRAAGYLPLNGGTLSGALALPSDPAAALHAATKQYVDAAKAAAQSAAASYTDAGLATKSDTGHTHAWSAITDKGLAEGTTTQDPNTAQSHVIVTAHANCPDAVNYWHITTTFYSALTGNRAQIAVQYSGGAKVYARSYYSGDGWQSWVRCDLGEGATRSIGTSGYAKIPGAGGLMIQWGYWTNASTSGTVTFPVAFPSTAFAVTVVDGTYFNGGHQTYVPSMSQSGFTWARGSPAASATSYWIAVGV